MERQVLDLLVSVVLRVIRLKARQYVITILMREGKRTSSGMQ